MVLARSTVLLNTEKILEVKTDAVYNAKLIPSSSIPLQYEMTSRPDSVHSDFAAL